MHSCLICMCDYEPSTDSTFSDYVNKDVLCPSLYHEFMDIGK